MIDWDRVRTLGDEIGLDDFDEVVELFLAEVSETITQLEQNADDASSVCELMHFLKGASLNLGFSKLADLSACGERAAADGDLQAVPITDLIAVLNASVTQFHAERASQLAA